MPSFDVFLGRVKLGKMFSQCFSDELHHFAPVNHGVLFRLRHGNDVLTNHVTDSTTAGMQHDPNILVLIEALLDEMIAASEAADSPDPALLGLALHM